MKVLCVITTALVPYGGLATVVMNYYRAMDRTGLQIDIASTNETPECLVEELCRNGSNYYRLGNRKKIFSYLGNLWKVLKNNYDVVHVNGNSATMLLELLPARIKNVPVRIAHVHTTRTEHPMIHKLIYPLFRKAYNKAFAVSDEAGKWLFGENYSVLNNAIDVKKYVFSQSQRDNVRKKLNIAVDTLVIGNVGKLNDGKNHQYLLHVFCEIKKTIHDSVLVIVGGGELEKELKEKANELGISDSVILTGMVDDASGYIQAFDFFAFPSKYEGLGLALVEAQASGLRCIMSDRVPKEAIVTDQVKVMSLDGGYDGWASYIVENFNYHRSENSELAVESIKAHCYDITTEAEKLRKIYLGY